jgi:hypothetical protein
VIKYLDQLDNYAAELESFIATNSLPNEWFLEPDHIAIKGVDGTDYEDILESFRPVAKQITYIEMDGRRLGTANLTRPIVAGDLGSVSWVEIMEPRPERIGSDVVGLEHMEFCYPNFDEVTKVLRSRGIEFEPQQNPGHSWINIVINDKGQELKINDRPLAVIVEEEIKSGLSKIL